MNLLNKIQQSLKAPKNQFNKFGDFKYRSCEDILEAVKPLLGEATLVLTDELINVGVRYYIKAKAILQTEQQAYTATAYAREIEARPKMDPSQITGSASSYARKYALNGLFCIDDTRDADVPQEAGKKPPTRRAAAKTQPPKQKSIPEKLGLPKFTNAKTEPILKALADYYKQQEVEGFTFAYEKMLSAIYKKYQKWPTTETGARRIKQEIMFIDVSIQK